MRTARAAHYVWIETIPLKKLNYVQNVLAFEAVYRNLNQRQALF